MRGNLIRKYLKKEMKGIEIAPWHNPIVAKKDGYDVQILDIFGTAQLREKCLADNNIPSDHLASIEEVDFVASALEIDRAVENIGRLGTYDYILSSHNFEHLPNPIKFLQACDKVLKTGGHLSMAIPAKNHTFDFYRNLTTTTDFFESYFENRVKPSPYQIYDFSSCFANNVPSSPDQPVSEIVFNQDFEACYQELKRRIEKPEEEYIDTHVSVFTADSFKLIISELISLGIISFMIKEIIVTDGFEFFVHLEKIETSDLVHYKLSHQERLDLYSKVYGAVKVNRPSYGYQYIMQ
jgi:SAM-dependent methyltransferase